MEGVEDVLRRALEAQYAEERWIDKEGLTLAAHISEGYRQVARGELVDDARARREIEEMKEGWRSS